MPPYWLLFGKRLDTILLRHRIKKYPDSPSIRVADYFLFQSGDRIKDICIRCRIRRMRADQCGGKSHLERKSCRFKNISIGVDPELKVQALAPSGHHSVWRVGRLCPSHDLFSTHLNSLVHKKSSSHVHLCILQIT